MTTRRIASARMIPTDEARHMMRAAARERLREHLAARIGVEMYRAGLIEIETLRVGDDRLMIEASARVVEEERPE